MFFQLNDPSALLVELASSILIVGPGNMKKTPPDTGVADGVVQPFWDIQVAKNEEMKTVELGGRFSFRCSRYRLPMTSINHGTDVLGGEEREKVATLLIIELSFE